MKTMLKKFLQSNINGILFWSFVATILGFFSKYCFLTDICCHFRLQYFLIGLTALIFYYILKTKDRKTFAVILIVLCLNFAEIIHCIILSPSQVISKTITADKTKMRIGLVNLLTSNKKYEKVKNELLQNNADILVVEEIDKKWSSELEDVKKIYEYKYEHIREDNFGIAIYSKIPVINFNNIVAGFYDEISVLSATVDFNGNIIEIIGIHTIPPSCNEYFKNTRQMLDDIGEYVNSRNMNSVVIGDINSSRFSYNYKNFLNKSKMQDVGNIFQLTWPTYWILPLRIPLDHIFVSKNIGFENFKIGNNVGSDHFPVFVDIFIK